jgi:rhodanese-related sulfurtransferase
MTNRSKACCLYPSRPTWGIASLRQATDFTPGYIAGRACWEYELFRPRWHDDVAYTMYNVVCSSMTNRSKACYLYPSRPTWGIASLRQATDFTPGYIAGRACWEYELFRPHWHDDVAYTMYNVVCRSMTNRSKACYLYPSCSPTWGIASLRQATDFTPGYIAGRACWEYELFRPRWHDDVAYTMYNIVCRSMTIEARYAASARQQSAEKCKRCIQWCIWRSLRW